MKNTIIITSELAAAPAMAARLVAAKLLSSYAALAKKETSPAAEISAVNIWLRETIL